MRQLPPTSSPCTNAVPSGHRPAPIGHPGELTTRMLDTLADIGEGVWVWNCLGEVLFANDQGAALLGWGNMATYQAQGCPHPWARLTLWDSQGRPLPPSRWPHTQLLRGEVVSPQVVQCRLAQLPSYWVHLRGMPWVDTAGQVWAAILFLRALSPLEVLEVMDHSPRAIAPMIPQGTPVAWDSPPQAIGSPVGQILDALPNLVAYLDQWECHQYANQAYAQAFQKSLGQVLCHSLEAVVGVMVYPHLQGGMARALAGEVVTFDMPLPDGAETWCYKHVTLIPHPVGKRVVGVYALFNDITAHKRAADLIQDHTNHLRDALEGGAVGIWEWDLTHHTLAWSAQQEQLFGLRSGGFDGRPSTFVQLVHPDDRDRLPSPDHITPNLPGFPTLCWEFRVLHPDGTLHWLSSRGQVFCDQEDRPLRIAGVTWDVTAQHLAEDRLHRQLARERLVAKVSQEISQGQDLQVILQASLADVREFLAVDRLLILDLHSELTGRVTVEARVPQLESLLQWELRDPLVLDEKYLRLYRQERLMAVNDVRELALAPEVLEFLAYFNIRAEVLVPLLQEGSLWGVLVAHCCQPRHWLGEDIRLLSTLATHVNLAIQRDRLHRQLTRANQQLKRLAYLDGLTQVANRRRFEEYLEQEWRRLAREDAPLAVIMADIDHFKAYNDHYGHQVGDDCLRQVAALLRGAVQRPADLVARYGGEEFVVVLPHTDQEGALQVAEKMCTLVRSRRIPHQGNAMVGVVTLSLGVATTKPALTRGPEVLLRAADDALYQAKGQGRDRVVVAAEMSLGP